MPPRPPDPAGRDVLILGCGYVGTRVARALVAEGDRVTATTRSTPPDVVGVEHVALELATAIGGGSPPLPPEPRFTHALVTAPPVEGVPAADVARWIQEHLVSPSSWVGYVSSTSVYGDSQGAWVDEDSPCRGESGPARARRDHEAAFRTRFPVLDVFRAAAIYGPGRSAFERLLGGRVTRLDKPGHVFSRVHVDDLARMIRAALDRPDGQRIFNGSDDEPTPQHEFLAEAARLLGREPSPLLPFESADLSPRARRFWEECRRVSSRRSRQILGIEFHYPDSRRGLEAILAAGGVGDPPATPRGEN